VELVARLRGEIDGRAEINVMNFQLDAENARRIRETCLARHQLRETLSSLPNELQEALALAGEALACYAIALWPQFELAPPSFTHRFTTRSH
jgi:hypothetical protein